MISTLSASYWRFFLPCIRKRRLLLFVIIFCGIIVCFLQEHPWVDFSIVPNNGTTLDAYRNESSGRKLVFLQLLFRHGHHSPFSIYPTDPNPGDYWVQGLGELTKIGRIQHYAIGKYLRQMYDGFLGYSVQEVDCMTSLSSRSHYGAYAFLAGLYPAPPHKTAEMNLPVQPIPCSFDPIKEDKYLQSAKNCKVAELEKSAMFKIREARDFMKEHQDLYKFWSENSGLNIKNYKAAGYLHKTLMSEKTENLTIPDWAKHTWLSLEENSNKCYRFHFKTRLLQRLRAGPLIGEILEKMKYKIQNPHSNLKVFVYSGHGSNVAALLNALRIYNERYPTYASTIMLELHQDVGGGHSIRLLLSNATEPERHIPPPHVLQLPGCDEYCPLEELERQTADLHPVDWKKECREENQQ